MQTLLVIGIGNPTPSFIQRRLAALVRSGIQLIVVVEYEHRVELKGAKIIRLGNSRSGWSVFISALNILSDPFIFIRMLSARPELTFAQRLRWAIKHFPLARIKSPDVIHIQWLSAVTEYQWLRSFFTCPVIGSARGSQVTVYLFTRPGYRKVIDRAIHLTDYIHCVSHDIARTCERLGAAKEKLIVNYNGIDLQHFRTDAGTPADSPFTLISVGAMMWRKGYVYQLQLIQHLRAAGRNVRLLCIGDGPDKEALQYQAIKMEIADRIEFVGKVKAQELPAWLSKAHVYISTSAAEGLANSVVEACACSLPVVAFACEGMEEILEEDVNGFILPYGDIEGLATRIQVLMDSSKKRLEMGAASRKHVEENFDEQHWVLQMIKTYTSLERN